MPWLVWLAVALLALTAAVVAVGGQMRVAVGRLWWVALSGAGLAWLLGLGALPRHGGRLWQWRPVRPLPWPHGVWRLHAVTWPWVMAVLTLTLAALVLEALREPREPARAPTGWALLLLVGALGAPMALAFSPLTLVAGWTLVDVAAAWADMRCLHRAKHLQTVARVAFGRALTWLLAATAAVIWTSSPATATTLWLIAILTRWMLAGYSPGVETEATHGWRLVLAAEELLSTLMGVLWLTAQPLATPSSPWALGLVALFALWGALRWWGLRSSLRRVAASGWALGSLALLAALQQDPHAALAWALLAFAPAVGLALLSWRSRGAWWFAAALLFPLTLWPFTPGAAAAALWQPPWRAWHLAAALTLLIAGMALFRHFWAKPQRKTPLPRERRAFAFWGWGLWAAAFWAARLWPAWRPPQPWALQWWLPGGLAVIVAGGLTWRFARSPWRLRYVGVVFGRGWLTPWFWRLYRLAAQGLNFFSLLLEGEGGVLWAWVLLIMLLALLFR